jgi:hypothetical protein
VPIPALPASPNAGEIPFPRFLQFGEASSKHEVIDLLGGRKDPAGQASSTATPSTIIQASSPPTAIAEQAPRLSEQATIMNGAGEMAAPKRPFSAAQQLLAPAVRNRSGIASGSQLDDSMNTQSSMVQDMKAACRDMMRPEQITQGDTQPWSIDLPSHPAMSKTTASPSRATISPAKTLLNNLACNDKPVLSPTKAGELTRSMQQLRQTAHAEAKALAPKGKKKKKNADLVLCQCEHPGEEDDMAECTYCGTWQHLHCYGYTGLEDPRFSAKDHTCYRCLLREDESATLTKLIDLARKRRAMSFALQHGLKTLADFADDMGKKMAVHCFSQPLSC